MPFNSTGLNPKTQEAILVELNSDVIKNVRTQADDNSLVVDTSSTAPIGKLNAIYSGHLANIWEQAKLVEQSMRTGVATGVSLEKLALLVGFLRRPASYTRGDLRFIGTKDTIIPAGSIFASLQDDNFSNPTDILITPERCYTIELQVGILVPNREYKVTINNTSFSLISSSSPTTQEVLQGLATLITADPDYTATFQENVDDPTQAILFITNQSSIINVTYSTVLTSANMEVEGLVLSADRGVVFGDANTIVKIITSQSGLDRVYNPADFIIGAIAETDTELRTRVQQDYNTVGSGTKDTITAILERTVNIRSALVEENRTFTTLPVTNIPPKSYEVIVNHEGTEEEIAQIIWDTKPLAISTYGDITANAKDSTGVDQPVNFSLAIDQFVYLRIRGTKLDAGEGETLPANYKEIIANAITVLGNQYNINVDVIGKRFFGTIYSNVDGIDELTVQVYLDTDANLDPATIPSGSWKDTWAVGRKQIASFSTERFDTSII